MSGESFHFACSEEPADILTVMLSDEDDFGVLEITGPFHAGQPIILTPSQCEQLGNILLAHFK